MNKRTLLLGLLLAVLAGLLACSKRSGVTPPDPLRHAYDVEPDWTNPERTIPLDYQQAQGKRLFYGDCVWCHADSTPAGPSNRSNLTPQPPLMNDGAALNGESNEYMENIITLGGSAMGKSAMMPPYGKMLTQDEVRAIIAYTRAIAQPPYKPPARPGPKYTVR